MESSKETTMTDEDPKPAAAKRLWWIMHNIPETNMVSF